MELSMSLRARRSRSVFLALALLAGMGVLLVGESFFHTDDGCPVETHCLTCKWAAGSTAIATPDLTQALALELRGFVPAPLPAPSFQVASSHAASRGPPQA